MATSTEVAQIRVATGALVEAADRDLETFWTRAVAQHSAEEVRDLLLEFVPELTTHYGDAAASLGADWYTVLRDDRAPSASRASFDAIAAPTPTPSRVQASTRWAVGPLFADAGALALEQLGGTVQRFVLEPFRDSIAWSAATDSIRTRVLRQPSGSDTCEFCIMLASRGPVYHEAAQFGVVTGRGSLRTGYDDNGVRLRGGIGGGIRTRGPQPLLNEYHDRCDCVPVIVQSPADIPSDYDQQKYLEMYAQMTGEGRYSRD